MTTPVTRNDIVAAAASWLLSKPDVTSSVSMFNIDGRLVPGVYQYRLWTPLEGTSQTAMVLSYEGGWATANMHNTMRFPRLLVTVWADPIRNSSLNVIDPGEVQRRVMAVYEAVDRHLHHVAGNGMWWDDVRVISCVRMVEPVITNMTEGDGLVRLQVYYAVSQG